jgi:hypothetical protein
MACGDHDEDSSSAPSTGASTSPTTAQVATDPTADAGGGENAELCALAEEMFDQEDFPSAAQIEKYTELAPGEIEDAVAIAGPPIIEAAGNPAKFFVAIADDDVEDAIFEIDDRERENCGIDHEPAYPERRTRSIPKPRGSTSPPVNTPSSSTRRCRRARRHSS